MTCQPMTATFSQPRAAVRDLLAELKTRGQPAYPCRSWWLALEFVESHDTMRRTRELNDRLWPEPARVVVARYIEDTDPHRLVFCGFAVHPAPRPPIEEKTVDGKILDPNCQRDLRRARAAYRTRRREAPLLRKRDALRLKLRHWCMGEVGRQKAVAQALAIGPSLLSNWLSERQPIPLKYCPAIERLLLAQSNAEVIAL